MQSAIHACSQEGTARLLGGVAQHGLHARAHGAERAAVQLPEPARVRARVRVLRVRRHVPDAHAGNPSQDRGWGNPND